MWEQHIMDVVVPVLTQRIASRSATVLTTYAVA